MKENFRDNFVIATFFRDYRRAATPVRTIHVVAPPITARGSHFAIVWRSRERWYDSSPSHRPLFLPLVPSAIVSLATSSTWLLADSIQERSCLDVLADLAGNFCSFFESKRTESETALTNLGSTRSLALGCTHDCLGSHAHNSTKFSWEKFLWSEVKSRNSRKYCPTKTWSYTVCLHLETRQCLCVQRWRRWEYDQIFYPLYMQVKLQLIQLSLQ